MDTEVVRIVSMEYKEDTDSLEVEVPLPNAKKETIDLQVYYDGFALRALLDDREDAEYLGQFALCCPVDQDAVTADYSDGLLRISFPLHQAATRPRQVKIR